MSATAMLSRGAQMDCKAELLGAGGTMLLM